jgi:hypothetical protein
MDLGRNHQVINMHIHMYSELNFFYNIYIAFSTTTLSLFEIYGRDVRCHGIASCDITLITKFSLLGLMFKKPYILEP